MKVTQLQRVVQWVAKKKRKKDDVAFRKPVPRESTVDPASRRRPIITRFFFLQATLRGVSPLFDITLTSQLC